MPCGRAVASRMRRTKSHVCRLPGPARLPSRIRTEKAAFFGEATARALAIAGSGRPRRGHGRRVRSHRVPTAHRRRPRRVPRRRRVDGAGARDLQLTQPSTSLKGSTPLEGRQSASDVVIPMSWRRGELWLDTDSPGREAALLRLSRRSLQHRYAHGSRRPGSPPLGGSVRTGSSGGGCRARAQAIALSPAVMFLIAGLRSASDDKVKLAEDPPSSTVPARPRVGRRGHSAAGLARPRAAEGADSSSRAPLAEDPLAPRGLGRPAILRQPRPRHATPNQARTG